MICEHGLVEFCSCLERRPPVYVAPHVEMRPAGERVKPWSCQCRDPFTERPLRSYQRHRSATECLAQEDVEAFKAKHGLKNDGLARSLMFIEGFAP